MPSEKISLSSAMSRRLDRVEQLLRRGLAIAFAVLQPLQPVGLVARLQREDVRRLADRQQAVVVKELDLLFAQAIDVEGLARDEVLEVFLALERAGELARAAAHDAFHPARGLLADHRRFQIARADLREFEGNCILGR
jgi:polyferredoxin